MGQIYVTEHLKSDTHATLEPACSHCGRHHLQRAERSTFFERRVYPYFGYYPWECAICRKITLLKMRGKKARRKKHSSRNGEERG